MKKITRFERKTEHIGLKCIYLTGVGGWGVGGGRGGGWSNTCLRSKGSISSTGYDGKAKQNLSEIVRCSLAFIALLFLNTVWSEKRSASAKGILSRDVYLVWCTMSPSLPSPPFSGNSACRVVYLARARARGTCVNYLPVRHDQTR